MVMYPECAPVDAAFDTSVSKEMPAYQSVTVPLRQLNRAACPEAEDQDQSRRGAECGSLP
jgi:hypothetical protein